MFPRIHGSCYIAGSAVVVGNALIGRGVSIWPNAVVRADLNTIEIGAGTNIQDCCIVHATMDHPTRIGRDVSVGHGAVVHACTIEDEVIVGMNATVLDGATVGTGSIIGANALVKAGETIPPYSLVLGVPGKVVKTDEALAESARKNAATYHMLRDQHLSDQHLDNRTFFYTLVDLVDIKPHEEIIQENLDKLLSAVKADGILRKPVLLDRRHKVVLDGHHRVAALTQLGYSKIPVYMVDYDDERILLDFWPEAEVKGFGKEAVIEKAVKGEKYPPKTTRHIIKFEIKERHTPLEELE